jgi:CrcB protein
MTVRSAWRTLPWVAAGGAVGALLRYALVEAAPHLATTLFINVLGSFLLGLLVSRCRENAWARAVLGTGVLGGFTTWSALAVQVVDASPIVAVLYLALTLGLGTTAARLGLR